jgi:hypothetical protein
MADTEDRPQRFCDSCGGVDDAPRHVYGTADGEGLSDPAMAANAVLEHPEHASAIFAHIQDRATVVKHMDCCAADGCPDGTCNVIHEMAPGTSVRLGFKFAKDDGVLRNKDLLKFILDGNVDHVGQEANEARQRQVRQGEEFADEVNSR